MNNFPAKFQPLRTVAQKLGKKIPQIRSIYLFGSVARGDPVPEGDLDLLFLLQEEVTSQIQEQIGRDPDFNSLYAWTKKHNLEGGPSYIVSCPEEFVRVYDTLVERIEQEGVLLYGELLKKALYGIDREKYKPKENLLDLVESL